MNDEKIYDNDYLLTSDSIEKTFINGKDVIINNINKICNVDNHDEWYINGYVSLDDILNLMRTTRSMNRATATSLEINLKTLLEENSYIQSKYREIDIVYFKFDYQLETFSFAFCYDDVRTNKRCSDEVVISKENNFWISNNKSAFIIDILKLMSDILNDYYSQFTRYKDFKNDYNYVVQSANSAFLVKFTNYDISLYFKDSKNILRNNFFTLTGYSYKSKLNCSGSNFDFVKIVDNKKHVMFKNVFIRIEDAPLWCQDKLRVLNEKRIEAKNKKKVRRKFSLFKKKL